MSAHAREHRHKTAFWLSVLLVVIGLGIRCAPNNDLPTSTDNRDVQMTSHIAHFLARQGLPPARWVHYTRDGGIRGLQIELPECHGNLQLAVMPEGDEFLNLWEIRSSDTNHTNSYVFDTAVYDDFPLYTFWWSMMSYALAHRLHISSRTHPGPVIALAYPEACTSVRQIPWQLFKPFG